jgi:G3E family GTPase
MIDPVTALAAISSAVTLIKKAVKTAQDVESLGPVLSKYFTAKEQAIEVVKQSQKGDFKGSALGKAMELELLLEQSKQLEEQIKGLFWSANKMDVWMRITARAKQMETDAAHAARRKKEAAQRRSDEIEEMLLIAAAAVTIAILIGVTFYFVLQALQKGY